MNLTRTTTGRGGFTGGWVGTVGVASTVPGFTGRVEFATTATPVRLAKSRLIALGVTALPRATGLPPTVGFAMA